MKARVFLSCGQRKETDEQGIADQVARRIEELGFECYVATNQQTLLSLRESIFSQLESNDYFVFIDFKRDELKLKKGVHRGSLFSHQELAIASFLGMPEPVILQEQGVEPMNGMLAAFQGNAKPFSDRQHLPAIIADEIQRRLACEKWTLESHNTLTLHCGTPPYRDSDVGNDLRRTFHISVRNNRALKPAADCFAYLERVEKGENGETIPLETIEFKWTGTTLPSVRVGPHAFRRFDACWFERSAPSKTGFNVITDSPHYLPVAERPGSYRLTFAVVSGNFSPARKSFRLTYDGSGIDRVKLDEE